MPAEHLISFEVLVHTWSLCLRWQGCWKEVLDVIYTHKKSFNGYWIRLILTWCCLTMSTTWHFTLITACTYFLKLLYLTKWAFLFYGGLRNETCTTWGKGNTLFLLLVWYRGNSCCLGSTIGSQSFILYLIVSCWKIILFHYILLKYLLKFISHDKITRNFNPKGWIYTALILTENKKKTYLMSWWLCFSFIVRLPSYSLSITSSHFFS